MMKGIFYGGRVYFKTSENKIKNLIATNTHEWWASANQEVLFEIKESGAFILKLGKKNEPEYVKKYCREVYE